MLGKISFNNFFMKLTLMNSSIYMSTSNSEDCETKHIRTWKMMSICSIRDIQMTNLLIFRHHRIKWNWKWYGYKFYSSLSFACQIIFIFPVTKEWRYIQYFVLDSSTSLSTTKRKKGRRTKKNVSTETGPFPQSHAQDLFCCSCVWKPSRLSDNKKLKLHTIFRPWCVHIAAEFGPFITIEIDFFSEFQWRRFESVCSTSWMVRLESNLAFLRTDCVSMFFVRPLSV